MSNPLKTKAEESIDGSLLREFYLIAWGGAAGLVLGSLLLVSSWQWIESLQWLAQASLAWAFMCCQTKRRLSLNRKTEEAPIYSNLGWANRLTLFRAWLIAAVAGFLFQPWPEGTLMSWLPGMLYLFAAVFDRVDGFVARRTGQSSLLGLELDTVSDALGLAVASLLAYGYGQVHWSYLLFGIAYYLFHAGILWRNYRGLPVYPLPPALNRRTWAGFQMGYLVVALWPLFYPPLTSLAGFAFMLPAVLGFLVDWLIVSGRINRWDTAVDRRFKGLTSFSYSVFQPVLRAFVVAALTLSLMQSGFTPLPIGSTAWMNNIMLCGFLLTSLMLLLGIAGRYFSLILVGLLGWYYLTNPLQPLDYALFCGVVWLLLLGTGRFSLWTEDEHWLKGYDGA
jgi:CDP-diacylglycerol---glycerol-3-phosphate 3-phosphatidyltransferase